MIRTGEWISEAWELFKQDWLMHVVVMLILWAANSATAGILYGPLLCGYYYMILKKVQDPTVSIELGDIGKGFEVFVNALVACLLVGIFTSVGTIACFVGAIVVAALLVFVFPLIMDRRMDFWPAIQASFDKTKGNWLGWSVFMLLLGLLYLAGAIVCGVGVLVTGPIAVIATALAYRDNFGRAGAETTASSFAAPSSPPAPEPPATPSVPEPPSPG